MLIVLLFVVVQFDSVQTFFAKRLTAYLSTELNAKINIDKVSIRFVKSVVLKGLYIEDQHGDTLLYAADFDVDINDISTKKHFLELNTITLSSAKFHLHHYKGDEHDNLHFLTSYFASSDTSTKGAPWLVKVKNVKLQGMEFTHHEDKDTSEYRGVNFSHLDVTGINGDFRDLSSDHDTIFVNIASLQFKEKCGFDIQRFSAHAKVSSSEVVLNNLRIVSPNTNISTDLTFQFNGFKAFDEFTHDVRWQSDFHNSTISFKDIAYFATDLWGLDKSVKLEGFYKGSVNNFKGKNVYLGWGDHSYFKGSVSMHGLPFIEDTYMDVNATEIVTDKSDVQWFPVAPFEEKHTITIPENLASLGKIRFKGKFTGFVSDFVAFGNVNTALGSISSDLNFKYNKNTHQSVYSGHLAAHQFNAGTIMQDPSFGKVSFSVDVKGKGLKLANIDAKLKGSFSQLEFRNYSYHNITVDGELSRKLFNGSLIVNEPNVDFDFKGSVDFRNALPQFHFLADIRSIRLDTINIYNSGDKTVLQAALRTQFEGNALDNITGGIEVEDINFQTGSKLFHVNEINLTANRSSKERTIDITSDFLDAHFNGKFELLKLGDSFKEILPHYLPSVILPRKSFTSNQDFDYSIRLKNLNAIAETFIPAWSFAPNTSVNGHFNSLQMDLLADLSTPWIRFNNLTFENLNLRVTTIAEKMTLDLHATQVLKGDRVISIAPDVVAGAKNNRIDFTINIADVDTLSNKAYLDGRIDFTSASVFDLRIDTSSLIIEREPWIISKDNLIHFDSSNVAISNLIFSKGMQSLSLDGKITRKSDEKFALHMTSFDISNLNSFLFANKTRLNGFASGDVSVTDIFGKMRVESDLKVGNFALNGDTIGNASVRCAYDNELKIIDAEINVVKGTARIIDISGKYFADKKENNLDFKIKLNNLYVNPLNRYVEGVMRQLHGKLTADLTLTGSFLKPVFNGVLDLNKFDLIVDYLNTHYSFSSTVQVKDNEFLLNDLKIYDDFNNSAVANGRVYHDYFKNFKFDVELQAKKFHVLNTTVKNNLLYYGTAYATGYAHFYGPLENMNMDISMQPEKLSGDKMTVLNIPLNTTEDLTSSSFITFINRGNDSTRAITRGKVDLSGVNLTLNLEMDPDAKVNIIFDEKIGDVISGTGTGSLRLEIAPSGTFNMFGAYTIDKGDYLFTLQNLINKRFKIESGGTITWAGDPYSATIDITAVYVVNTSSLYNVIPSADEALKSVFPVDLIIHLTNKLMNPTIAYEINVRDLRPTEAGMLKTILNSEQELNRQMLGLLVLNQFVPYNGNTNTGSSNTAVAANASEVLSAQVSNWLSQIEGPVTWGFNYRAKDSYSQEEVKIIARKSLINDRLTIEGDVGVVGGDPESAKSNNTVVGDFYATYKLGKDGRYRLKGFNRSNANNIINYSESPYTQGVGFMYRKEFDKLFKKAEVDTLSVPDKKQESGSE
jgi:hypothetical protein